MRPADTRNIFQRTVKNWYVPKATPKVTVAWCPDCLYWVVSDHIGSDCLESPDCERTLVKRVGYLCQEPDIPFPGSPCLMFHRTVGAMKACKHDAY